MIKLYYTGATSWQSNQNLATKSVGGFISNNTIPNGDLNSLFGNISSAELFDSRNKREVIGLGLYAFFFTKEEEEEFKKAKLKISLKHNHKESYINDLFTFKFALGPVGGDETQGFYLEKIQSNKAIPYYYLEEFKELSEEPIFTKEYELDKGIGLWISRTFNSDKVQDKFSCKSDYWLDNDKLPNFDFELGLEIKLEK